MRLTVPQRFEQFGSVQIHEIQRVLELDAGSGPSTPCSLTVSSDALKAIEQKMAIVVLCMNEEFKTIESVFSGIPHDCLIILASNSSRQQIDRYHTEVNILRTFCRDTDRLAMAIHQKDPGAAKAFGDSGVPELIGKDGLIHNGKGEGMLIGMALAALAKREYIGFVDADNYIPGSVLEYCKSYAAGLHLATTPDAMVRVSWSSKPKERQGRLMFDRKGRSSKVVNEWLNNLLQHFSGYGTECIATGNAGEHAMSMKLGMKLRLASGFAVEPYEYIYLLEQLSGQFDEETEEGSNPQISRVHIHQIETRNPHLHDNKGDEHVNGMRAQALNMLYHSQLTPESMKKALCTWMEDEKMLCHGQVPPVERVYPAIESLDFDCLRSVLQAQTKTFEAPSGHSTPKASWLFTLFPTKPQQTAKI